MRKFYILTLVILVTTSLGASAWARHDDRHDGRHTGRYSDRGPFIDYAKVVDVEPLTKAVRKSVPRRECWDEEVVHRESGRRSTTGTVLGGLIGGAIGNELGHNKSNQRVGAVAGAVLGASIGSDLSRKRGSSYVATEEVCKVYHDSIEEERVVGYKVRYRYRGQEFITRTKRHPGKRIKVRVNVSPVS